MGSVTVHLMIGAFWGTIAIAVLWKDGRWSAIKSGFIAAAVMAAFSAGCDSVRIKNDSDCRPAGPGIYNDC